MESKTYLLRVKRPKISSPPERLGISKGCETTYKRVNPQKREIPDSNTTKRSPKKQKRFVEIARFKKEQLTNEELDTLPQNVHYEHVIDLTPYQYFGQDWEVDYYLPEQGDSSHYKVEGIIQVEDYNSPNDCWEGVPPQRACPSDDQTDSEYDSNSQAEIDYPDASSDSERSSGSSYSAEGSHGSPASERSDDSTLECLKDLKIS